MEELNRYLSNLSEHHDMYVYPIYLFAALGHAGVMESHVAKSEETAVLIFD